ncbi:hypothetical protein EFA69_19230 [Rufibacter immobilis]|uniref:Uncharacterized protein n=1 Tax=Rufibacter immobilis TaxID=1348778 RepID=A0A3M9MRP0_9BACT|nr:hypothetical protein EFA69_19230 [Rufibacter immobilis]
MPLNGFKWKVETDLVAFFQLRKKFVLDFCGIRIFLNGEQRNLGFEEQLFGHAGVQYLFQQNALMSRHRQHIHLVFLHKTENSGDHVVFSALHQAIVLLSEVFCDVLQQRLVWHNVELAF